MDIGKVAQRKSFGRKTPNSSVLHNNSIDGSPVVNDNGVAETHEQVFKEQTSPLHQSRRDYESTATKSLVDTKGSKDLRLLKNETMTKIPEEQSLILRACIDITKLEEGPSSEIPNQQLPPLRDVKKELKSCTDKISAMSTFESCPPAYSNLLKTHTTRGSEDFSEVGLKSERHNSNRILSQQRENRLPQESKSINMAPALDNNVPKDGPKTFDTVVHRGQSNAVNQLSEILGDTGAVMQYFKGPWHPTAKMLSRTDSIDLSTEKELQGEDQASDRIALQLMPQEQTSPLIANADSMSPDLRTSLPTRRTRSGARFSDDTNMLRDFVIRAHAKKAAKSEELTTMSHGGQPPQRSPCEVLGQLDKNSPTHTKSQDATCSLESPPGNASLDSVKGIDNSCESCGDSNLRRRSTRTCTIMPETTSVFPLCFIPGRRPEGSGPVILQKSAAQELGIATRANTRRNKGLSKLPKFMLETLNVAVVEDAPVEAHEIQAAKSVEWDEKLVYFQQSRSRKVEKEKKEGKAEVRVRAKSLQALGNIRGIPAPKSVVDKANPSNGTPAPKRRGKRKSK